MTLGIIGMTGCLVALGAVLLPAAETGSTDETASLSWLEGRWAGEKDGVASEERWTQPLGGALLGVHSDVKGERLVSWEFLRIATTKDGTFYFASPRSAPPTPFKLVENGDRRVVFENKEHDFPQRISYWLDAAGALHARIDGPQGAQTVSEEWVWTRKP